MCGRRLCTSATAAALCGALVLGAGVRLWGLAERSLWFDEAFSWRMASFSWPELLSRAAADNNPPLYYGLLKLWQAVAGEGLLALRVPSALCGVLTIVGGVLWARETADWQCGQAGERAAAKLAGAVAAWLIAASPLHVRWSWDARMYSLAAMLAAFSGWSLVCLLRRGRWRHGLTFAACSAALCYAHSTGVLFVGALACVVLLAAAMYGKQQCPGPAAGRVGLVVLLGLVAMAYAPWAVFAWRQARQVHDNFWSSAFQWPNAETALYQAFFDPEDPMGTYAAEGRWLAVFCVAVSVAAAWRATPGTWALVSGAVGSAVLLIAVSLAVRNLFFPRYLVLAHLAWLVLLGTAVARLPPAQGFRPVVAAVLGAGSAAVLWVFLSSNTRFWSSPGMRAAAAWVESQRRADEPVVASTTLVYFPLLYHMRDRGACRMYPDAFTLKTHYFGTAALLPGDVLAAEELRAMQGGTAWLVGVGGGGWGRWEVPVPREWRFLQGRRFREALPVQGEVVVEQYALPAPPADAKKEPLVPRIAGGEPN